MVAKSKSTASSATAVRQPSRLWLWFAGGLLLVFVGMLLLVDMTAMHSSGQYAVRSPLWLFYADGIARVFGPSTLGPASGSGSALLETALLHLLFSVAGGGTGAAIGWCISKLRSRKTAEPDATADGEGR